LQTDNINIPQFADDDDGFGNCCHGGGTGVVELDGGGIDGGMDDGKWPAVDGGNLGGVGGNCVHGGGGPDNCIDINKHIRLNGHTCNIISVEP